MSRKKKTTYGDMSRLMADMQRRMTEERKRMANVMSEALLSDIAATKLGDFSDTDLRRLMSLLSGHIDNASSISKLKRLPKMARLQRI